jgi:hypothetical protein
MCCFYTSILDLTVKTVSEEYTPLHLAARFKPPKTIQESEEDDKDEADDSKTEGTIEADGSSSLTRQNSSKESTIGYLLEICQGADVHVSQYNIIITWLE